jgi:hypothetical protein
MIHPWTLTPISELELLQALLDGHIAATAHAPSANRLVCAWGQCALECGRGKKLRVYNVGNITASVKYVENGGNYCVVPCSPPDPQTLNFRWYENAIDGAEAYWDLLIARYCSALAASDAGDSVGAARALKRAGYYTADGAQYEYAMHSLEIYCRENLLSSLGRLPEIRDSGEVCSTLTADEIVLLGGEIAADLAALSRTTIDEIRTGELRPGGIPAP